MADIRSSDRSEDILRSLADRRAATTVTAADDAVRDHLVHDVPVLPGVFLLDLVLRVVRQSGVDPARVELRRITFLAPVLGTGAGRRIEVRIGRTDEGAALPVTVRSRPLGPGEEWETNCRAELHPADPDLLERSIDPGRVTSRATRVVGVDELYGFARQLDIVHRGFMKASGVVHVGRDHALAEMRLAAEAGPYLSQFHAHPAVLDFATLVPLLLFQETQRSAADHAFIPLYVDSFHATGGIGPENLVHVPGPVGGRLDADLFEADLEICSPDGRIVARLGGFRAKRVRSADLITGRRGPVVGSRPGVEPVRAPESAGHSSPDSRATGLRETIAMLVAAKLGRDADDVDPELGFYDLGLTSLDLLDIAGSLEDGLGTQLYPTLLFEYPTVSALVDHLRGAGTKRSWGRRGHPRRPPARSRTGRRPPRPSRGRRTCRRTRTAGPSPLWAWRAGTRVPQPPRTCGAYCARAPIMSPGFRPTAGTTPPTSTSGGRPRGAATASGAPSATAQPTSTPRSSTSQTHRPRRWTRTSVCSSRRPGRRWRTPGTLRRAWRRRPTPRSGCSPALCGTTTS